MIFCKARKWLGIFCSQRYNDKKRNGRMEFSRNQIIKIALTLAFLCCMLFANFFAVRMMLRYGADTYFYDKLLVTYTIGGANGLKMELDKITVTDKLRRESILAKDFANKLETLAAWDIEIMFFRALDNGW